MIKERRNWKNFDFVLFLSVVLIFCIGLAFLYSATYQYAKNGVYAYNFLLRQITWFALSLLLGAIIIKVDYQKWIELGYPLYALNLLILGLVLFLGKSRFGAQRWISLGGITFQPSEFSKLIMMLTLARYLGQRKLYSASNLTLLPTLAQTKALVGAFLLVFLPFGLILKQPDLGTALTLLPLVFILLYVWGAHLWTLGFIILSGIVSTPFLWQLLKEYQKRRILVFINPDLDPLGAGYTIIQSKIAIGSGGILGKGWLSGTQNQLNFLPERHTDFIFSVVGEEWGFVGGILLLSLYLLVLWRGFAIAQSSSSLSGKLLASGIITLLAFQVVVNIAMTMGFLPVVGLPLPLISYGGSSLLATMISVFLLLNIGLRK